MNKQRNALFKSSKDSSQRLAKEAIKSGRLIEEEGTFPIYTVVLSHDKNDDIMIIHSTSFEPLQNEGNHIPEIKVEGKPTDVKKLPGDKPLRIITDLGVNTQDKDTIDS